MIDKVVGGIIAGVFGTVANKIGKDAAEGLIVLYGPHVEYLKRKLWPNKNFKIRKKQPDKNNSGKKT